MEDFTNKSYEDRIKDIKYNLYTGGGIDQANMLLNVLMSSFNQREFTGQSDISVDTVLSNISREMKHLKQVVRNGGIVPIDVFEDSFKEMHRLNDVYACLDKDLKFCVRHYGLDNWDDILYVFPYMNCHTAFDITFKYENIHQSEID